MSRGQGCSVDLLMTLAGVCGAVGGKKARGAALFSIGNQFVTTRATEANLKKILSVLLRPRRLSISIYFNIPCYLLMSSS